MKTLRYSGFLTYLMLMLSSGLSLGAPIVVTQAVGRVGDRVITSREVQIAAVLDRILFPSKNNKSFKNGIFEVRLSDPGMVNEVTAVLLEVVVHREAESFSVARVSDEELRQTLQKIEREVEGKAYWKGLEVGAAELKRYTLQKLTAKAFVQFKTNSMVGIVSDTEALAYYEKNRLKFGDLPFASFKENIKNFLVQQQLEERTRAWFEIIKRKYKVRNILAESLQNQVRFK